MTTDKTNFDQYYLEALKFEPAAMAALVQCYLQGHGTEVDIKRAHEWYQKLCFVSNTEDSQKMPYHRNENGQDRAHDRWID